jgi:hypothetical protein
MRIPNDIRNISFKTYHGIGNALDFIWHTCCGRHGDIKQAGKYIDILSGWRLTINKMRIYSSPELSLAERLNYSRACKDIDSLLFRLSRISGALPKKVTDAIESTSADPDQGD